jgi:aspartyl/glutamyl-tRNA(Asn/Gln) amidotransferase C subunit
MDKGKVLNLAKLARIEIGGEEATSLASEFGSILGYVKEIKEVAIDSPNSASSTTSSQHPNKLENVGILNVMRGDEESHEPGIYTEKILEQAPAKEGGYIKVKKIL